MNSSNGGRQASPLALPKTPTGIVGLDNITNGGLPTGRPTLVCGGPGCGKTLLGLEFAARGARQFGEPALIVTFEESPEELLGGALSLGLELDRLVAERKLAFDHVDLDSAATVEAGNYDLEGLLIRIGRGIDAIGARRVVLDTIDAIFMGFTDLGIVRSELRRLFRFLKHRGVTALVTCESGNDSITRHGLEQYVSDCVLLLDQRVVDQLSTRRLRVVKYRRSSHGTNEFPFLISDGGLSVLPVTSIQLEYPVSDERLTTGVPRLDAMLSGQGFYRGSSVLISGTAGTGKSSLATSIAQASCERGEKVLYFAFEESAGQIARNMKSIGLDVASWTSKGLWTIRTGRPAMFGLEMHLVKMFQAIAEETPALVVVDPVTNFLAAGRSLDVAAMVGRLFDYLKSRQITAVLTALIHDGEPREQSAVDISSVIDTWITLRDLEQNGERNRGLYILKSRGMAHSNQVREFLLTDHGIELTDVYIGSDGIKSGSARLAQEAREAEQAREHQLEIERRRREIARRRAALEAKLASVQCELEAERDELELMERELESRRVQRDSERAAMARSRHSDSRDDRSGTRGEP